MSSKNSTENQSSPGPVPLPPPNRRSSFSQNPSFSTLFGSSRGSPPRVAPDPGFHRRFSWSYAPPKESSSAIDDSDEIVTSPIDEARQPTEFGRRLSNTASSIVEALGFKADESSSPRAIKTVFSKYNYVPNLARVLSNKGNKAMPNPFPPLVPHPPPPKVRYLLD
jgi:hypothetical protein